MNGEDVEKSGYCPIQNILEFFNTMWKS